MQKEANRRSAFSFRLPLGRMTPPIVKQIHVTFLGVEK